MASTVRSIDKFHDTRQGKIVFGTLELLAALGLSVLAVDSGAIWQYVLTILLFIGGVRNLLNSFLHTKPHAKKSKR